MATLAIRLTPYRQARLAVYAERAAAGEDFDDDYDEDDEE